MMPPTAMSGQAVSVVRNRCAAPSGFRPVLPAGARSRKTDHSWNRRRPARNRIDCRGAGRPRAPARTISRRHCLARHHRRKCWRQTAHDWLRQSQRVWPRPSSAPALGARALRTAGPSIPQIPPHFQSAMPREDQHFLLFLWGTAWQVRRLPRPTAYDNAPSRNLPGALSFTALAALPC